MTELSNKLRQTRKDQSVDLKFMELLNSNRPLESIKDRQILPSIPLSSFNPSLDYEGRVLPPINKQKQIGKLRSFSQAKLKTLKNINDIGIQGNSLTNKINLIGNKMQRQQSLTVLQNVKNIPNFEFGRLRKRSTSSAKKSVYSKIETQQFNLKKMISEKSEQDKIIIQSMKINSLQNIQKSQKNIIQTFITPQKLKLDLPPNSKQLPQTKQSTQTKIMSNRTLIQQISEQATQNLMLNLRFGKIQQNISYKSFLKKQAGIISPQLIVKKLEQWASSFKIKNGLIHTKQLHKIFSRKQIANNMILSQFVNQQQLRKQYMNTMPGLKYYSNEEKGRNLAATKIQSLFHMIFERNYAKKLKSLMKKVKIIQKKWKSAVAAKKTRQKIMNNINMRIQKSNLLTNNFMKNWQYIKTCPRVQIHICSIALEQFKRLSIPDLHQREIAQLTRIFKSSQTECTIVYVAPYSFTGEIIRYYEKVFSFGNMGQSFRSRLYFISVQKTLQRISSHLTTVSALLYSPNQLNQIRQIIKQKQQSFMNQPCAYIVPSYPSNEYVNLSAQLDIPIFSSSQSLHKLYSTKSGYYCFLKSLTQSLGDKCPFLLPKTIHSIYSQKQLINILAVLIHKNKTINKWVLKIDDEISSRGLAIFNVDNLAFLKELRKQKDQLTQTNQQISQKQIIGLIADELKVKLKSKLKILHRNIYSNYEDYISHFLTRGGFIQQFVQPQQLSSIINTNSNNELNKTNKHKVRQHSISFKISPNGEFQILSTYQRFQLGCKIINSTIQSPSNVSVSEVDSQKIVRALYRHIWGKSKLFGYFTIDCLYVQNTRIKEEQRIKNKTAQGEVYIIGLDCFLNEKTSSMFIPALTSKSQYAKQFNKIYVPVSAISQEEKDYVKADQFVNQMGKQLTSRSITQYSYGKQIRLTDANNKKQDDLKEIYYIYCPFIKQNNLPNISTFFKQCKFSNISFDMQTKTGTLFLLEGGLENGCFGFMCMSNSKENVQQQALKLVQFLSKQFRNKNQKTHKSNSKNKNVLDEIGQLRGYLLNCLRKKKNINQNLRREDLNLQFIF